ncbi:hypothetical protein T484DRAFT_1934765 [Baffinella frigidus]|nr:hypothetical protein T484DRAFT_1934765 [Cryptophyta sp. CCMP2293]
MPDVLQGFDGVGRVTARNAHQSLPRERRRHGVQPLLACSCLPASFRAWAWQCRRPKPSWAGSSGARTIGADVGARRGSRSEPRWARSGRRSQPCSCSGSGRLPG